MSSTITIGLPLLVGFGFLYWSSLLDEDAEVLKLLFRFLFIPFAWLSIHIAVVYARLDYLADPELVEILADLVYYSSIILYLVGFYYLFMIVVNVYLLIMNKREKNSEEMYDG